MAIPDLRAVLQDVKARYPRPWALAHADYGQQGQVGKTTRAQAELFIRLAAYTCHQVDPRVGLNGKRGNPRDLSQDVLTFAVDGTFRQLVDVIGAAGGPNPTIVWNVFPPPLATDAEGYWLPPEALSDATIADILAGVGTIPEPPPPTPAAMPLAQAFTTLDDAFRRVQGRRWRSNEEAAIIDAAKALGWLGHDTIAVSIVSTLTGMFVSYTGDIGVPFGAPPPAIDPTHAVALVDQRMHERHHRAFTETDLAVLQAELIRQGFDFRQKVTQAALDAALRWVDELP